MIKGMRNTIKSHNDFQTDGDCPSVATTLFSIRTKKAKFPNDARYGLVVSKRNFRFAVKRNRVKRLLRDWIAFANDYMCPDLDYVFFARVAILNDDVTRDIGRKTMVDALQKIRKNNVPQSK